MLSSVSFGLTATSSLNCRQADRQQEGCGGLGVCNPRQAESVAWVDSHAAPELRADRPSAGRRCRVATVGARSWWQAGSAAGKAVATSPLHPIPVGGQCRITHLGCSIRLSPPPPPPPPFHSSIHPSSLPPYLLRPLLVLLEVVQAEPALPEVGPHGGARRQGGIKVCHRPLDIILQTSAVGGGCHA